MLDTEETASFDVDCQKGFTPLCPDELPVPDGDNIVSTLNEQAGYARIRVGSKDAHNRNAIWIADEENPQFSPIEGKNVDIRWNAHCIMGEKGSELLDGLPAIDQYDFFVWKGMETDTHPYGACYHDFADKMSTGVIEYLKQQGIKNVVVGGLATDYCVKTTALQLVKHFKVLVNLTACRGIAEDTIKTAIEEMEAAGVIVVEEFK